MTEFIIVVVLYVLGMGAFQLLGGLGAAGEALRRWGEAASSVKNSTPSPSS